MTLASQDVLYSDPGDFCFPLRFQQGARHASN